MTEQDKPRSIGGSPYSEVHKIEPEQQSDNFRKLNDLKMQERAAARADDVRTSTSRFVGDGLKLRIADDQQLLTGAMAFSNTRPAPLSVHLHAKGEDGALFMATINHDGSYTGPLRQALEHFTKEPEQLGYQHGLAPLFRLLLTLLPKDDADAAV